jgi:hypothetical protein
VLSVVSVASVAAVSVSFVAALASAKAEDRGAAEEETTTDRGSPHLCNDQGH